MTVLYFANARRITGFSEEEIPATEPLSISAFWEQLVQRHPDLASLRSSSRLARNNDFLTSSAHIEPTDEIAVIPPVSGG
ncbi:MoaD/ThiS family protein [Rariglobus hedericola]|uniref:Molybdopterin synthase sulfur carrier subunit n=1 Tax=Rariglobus hedericola TaxID=2597822 RepID=A0A556QQB8_9BACT|nr:MoaD/ThiS family protein [Rariglobus hedericola]TSJ78822.1 MoaD/ThiS family protein [Rariglobus hedericola]